MSNTAPAPKRTLVEAELERIAREGLRSHPQDFAAAVRSFQEAVERDPKLLIAIVTRDELSRIEAAFVQKVQKHDTGASLSQARGRVEPSQAEEKTRERWKTIREDAKSVLWTMMIDGEWLGNCTRATVEREHRVCGKRAGFLRELLAILPAGQDVVVKDAVTPAQADELWDRLPEAA